MPKMNVLVSSHRRSTPKTPASKGPVNEAMPDAGLGPTAQAVLAELTSCRDLA